MSHSQNYKRRPMLFTPWHELRRYGLKRAFLTVWTSGCMLLSVILSFSLPWGPDSIFDTLATVHGTMLGVGITVFGFTILGGKDDFFEPVMKAQGKAGLDALKDMVLLLFWPLILHATALALCLLRMSDDLFCATAIKYTWRVAYGFFALWSAVQSYQSLRYLFVLAITHLAWRYKLTSSNVQGQATSLTNAVSRPTPSPSTTEPVPDTPPPEPPRQVQ